MILDTTVQNVINLAEHDGSKIIFPDRQEPLCRAGHSMCEMVMVAIKMGYMLCPIVPIWEVESGHTITLPLEWVESILHRFDGVMLGTTSSGRYHAVAWNHVKQMILDPNGTIYPLLGHFTFESIWIRER